MSRIGNLPVSLPKDVTVDFKNGVVTVKGPKGELKQEIKDGISIEVEDGNVKVSRPTEQKRHKALHGLYRSLVSNMVVGVSQGYKIEQELVGVGYRASNQGQVLDLALGHSHHYVFELPEEIKVTTASERGKNPIITLEGIDKQLIGQVAAKIRSMRAPEPFKGKGVKFVGEQLRRKAGKAAAAK
ncbi:MAG: 50S ribosomal protein L6 [Bacteroidia bacterium]|nr:50S ribosomal protein L6 [Bacteroidia bacterium]